MARRRGRGEGSVWFWKEKNLWAGRINLPDGKKRTKYGKTQKNVKDWILTERSKLQQGIFVSDDKITFGAFLRRYLDDYCKRSLRVTTYESYKAVIEKNIIPELGTVRLSTLKAEHINHLLSKIELSGRSARHVEYVYAILKASLNKAVKWELLTKNPALLVSPPKVEFKVPATWSAEQLQTFLDHIEDDRWAAIYYLAGTGMRKGEILGLPLTALDLDKGYLMVIQTLQFVHGQGLLILEPKTEKSRRMIVSRIS
jgi:integrase